MFYGRVKIIVDTSKLLTGQCDETNLHRNTRKFSITISFILVY